MPAITKPGAKVLELGCGPGNITRYLLQHRTDWGITPIDVALDWVEPAQVNKLRWLVGHT